MTNPGTNAILAGLYIIGVVLLMQYLTKTVGPSDSLLIPLTMLSLFVLSSAVMGYLFLAGPAGLYLEGQKADAVRLFLATLVVFAMLTLVFFSSALYVGLKNQPRSESATVEDVQAPEGTVE